MSDSNDKGKTDGLTDDLPGFLTKESTLTPGLAGGLTLTITNVLAVQFDAPPNYTGIALSGLMALVVVGWLQMPLLKRGIWWVLNTLVIFTVALGGNQLGVNTTGTVDPSGTPAYLGRPTGGDPATGTAPNQFMTVLSQPKGAFFANWLDGTVGKRADLLAEIKTLDQDTAKSVLKASGTTITNSNFAKEQLQAVAAQAQNAETVKLLKGNVDRLTKR